MTAPRPPRPAARLLLGLAALAPVAAPQAAPPRHDHVLAPAQHDNVLVLLADDMGAERVNAYGLDVVPNAPTPTLDLLAKYGVLFRNAYAEPLCSPTRAAILTGKHPFRTGIGRGVSWNGGGGDLEADPADVTLADALSVTHRTTAVGKWHLSIRESAGGTGYQHPILYGFERHVGILRNVPNTPTGYWDWTKSFADASGDTQVAVTDTYLTTDQVDDAIAAIDEAGEDPWFVWVGFNTPHNPFHVPPADLITVDVDADSTNSELHGAMIEAMDTEIGRLLRSIRPAVLARTWIVFLGDNGSPGPALPGVLDAKGDVTEFGIHVPLIVVGPGVARPGREVDGLVGVTDLYATICDMARVPVPPEAEDSVSFYPNLVDPEAPRLRDHVYAETFRPNGPPPYQVHKRAVRSDRWKLVRNTPPDSVPGVGLYLVPLDPDESDNLFPPQTSAQQQAYAWLSALMLELQ